MSTVHRLHASQTVRETLAHFLRNPAAMDSLEGIARLRFLEQAIHRNLSETQDAFEWLATRGFIVLVRRRADHLAQTVA